jgi:hypothetical protein
VRPDLGRNDGGGGGHYAYLDHVLNFIESQGQNRTLENFRTPYIKTTLLYVWPLFVVLHALVGLGGVCGNAAMLTVIVRRRLYRCSTFFFLGHLAFSDLFKAAVVLPITVATMMMGNWIFGSFLCYFLPMMHSFPIHASMLTYMLMAIDRYRLILYPMKSRIPARLCMIASWVGALCAALPYAVYVNYYDLGVLVHPALDGVGVCWMAMSKSSQEYIRAMFVVLYCLPLAIMAFLYVRMSAEIKSADSPSVSVHFEENMHSDSTYHTNVNWSPSESERFHDSLQFQCPRDSGDDEDNGEIDPRKEKRTQKYLISMVMLFGMCWCPIHILMLVNHLVIETDDNQGHLDITYLTFTIFGFMSTCTTPVLFASWFMSDQTKDRLRGYFRFSNRRQSALSTRMTTASPPPLSSSHASPTRADRPHSDKAPPSPNGHVHFVKKSYF